MRQYKHEPYFGWCDVEGCENEGASGGICWRKTGFWTVCSKHACEYRAGEPQPKMKQSAIDREKRRGDDGVLVNALCILLALVLCAGCDVDNNGFGKFNTPREEAARIEDGQVKTYTTIIDSCEYIYISRMPWSDAMTLTHKGNCKYCKERNQN